MALMKKVIKTRKFASLQAARAAFFAALAGRLGAAELSRLRVAEVCSTGRAVAANRGARERRQGI